MWMSLAGASFAVALAPLVLARQAGSWLSAIKRGRQRLRNGGRARRLQTGRARHRPRRGVPSSPRSSRQGSATNTAHVGPTQLQHPRCHSIEIGVCPLHLEQSPALARAGHSRAIAGRPWTLSEVFRSDAVPAAVVSQMREYQPKYGAADSCTYASKIVALPETNHLSACLSE
jgi:hypothetical protein